MCGECEVWWRTHLLQRLAAWDATLQPWQDSRYSRALANSTLDSFVIYRWSGPSTACEMGIPTLIDPSQGARKTQLPMYPEVAQ
jgi:hypothetical protein